MKRGISTMACQGPKHRDLEGFPFGFRPKATQKGQILFFFQVGDGFGFPLDFPLKPAKKKITKHSMMGLG